MHSHHRLADIFVALWKHITPRGSFVDLVFRLVFFHQSLCGGKDFPPIVSLSQEERLIYCDEELFTLMRPLMVCDSSSYMFVMDIESRMDRCIEEFEESSLKMKGDWSEKLFLLQYHLS